MKRTIFLLLIVVMAATGVSVNGQTTFVPVGSKLDVESLNRHIDLDMDISELSLSDLRILRNAFAARQGYCFMDYALRSVFSQTSWYDSLLWARYDSDTENEVKYTKAETEFIDKLKAREAELKRRNFVCDGDGVVNTDNIVNKFQLEELSEPLYRRLARDGFAIVPRQGIQLFHCYENNDYHDFPNFITTDLHLQLMHMYFATVLREIEQNGLRRKLSVFVNEMYKEILTSSATSIDSSMEQAAGYSLAWLDVCNQLGGGRPLGDIPAVRRKAVADELSRVMAGTDSFSPFLGYTDTFFPYSLFVPRGNYARSDAMKQYFRSMMWLQSAPLCTASKEQARALVLMAGALNGNGGLRKLLVDMTGVLSTLVGQPDGLSLLDVAGAMEAAGLDAERLIHDDNLLKSFAGKLDIMSRQRMRIRPKEELSCREKIHVMPQRYLYDSEVMQELVDLTTRPTTLRGYPKGLDVMAAFGSDAATSILTGELKEQQRWPRYAARLDSIKALMPRLSADSTVYNCWMKALAAMMNTRDKRYPYFMNTPRWDKKNLNAALASWTELKHDVMLYSKQPMGAECGGCIPDPVVVGYVEPNTAYWANALALLRRVAGVLEQSRMMNGRLRALTEQVEEQTRFLLDVSEKELAGKRLTEAEFRSIEKLGSTYEWLTLDILKKDGSSSGMMWEDVQGTDKSVSVVTDVYTANASNNPESGMLHEAVGTVDDIFVVVEINGYLHLTRGAVFSYREFRQPTGTRLTDEQWQQMLEKSPRYGVPSWMDEIILKDPIPEDNELIFYSSGC